MKTKICNKCGVEKELDEFYKDKTSKDGYNYFCKVCHSEYKKRYIEDNKEKIKEKQKKYYEKNKEKQKEKNKEKNKEKQKEYREKNKNKINQYQKKYYIKNKKPKKKQNKSKEELKEKQKEYYKKNKEKAKIYGIQWREKNKENQKKYRDKNKEKIKERTNIFNKEKRKKNTLYRLSTNIRTLICNSIKKNGYKKSSKTAEILGCTFEEFKLYIESKFEIWMTWNNHGLYNGELNYGWDFDHIIPMSSAINEEETIKLNHYTNFQPLCSKMNRDIKRNKII